jgi:agarase
LVGRFDGENSNIGFVSQTDTPYYELIEAARQVNSTMYERRGG